MKKYLFFCFILLASTAFYFSQTSGNTLQEQEELIQASEQNPQVSDFYGFSFPPVTDNRQRNFTRDLLENTGVRKIRFETKWKDRETGKGNFHWGPLDTRIEYFDEYNVEILLTLSSELPEWVCGNENLNNCYSENKQHFQDFTDALMTRYQGKIAKVQFGNEWDNPNHFPADISHFVDYHNILAASTQEYAPETQVVLGGITRSALIYQHICIDGHNLDFSNTEFIDGVDAENLNELFYSEGCVKKKDHYQKVYNTVQYVWEHANYDLLDIHLYDDAENWDAYIDIVKGYTQTPLIVSEFGGVNPDYEIYNEDYHAGRVQKYLETVSVLDIQEAYYFKPLDDRASTHKESGLFIEDGSRTKAAYEIFQFFLIQ